MLLLDSQYLNRTGKPVLEPNWQTSTWTELANQYWARPGFHNGHGTTLVLPDTGAVLTISTAFVLSECGDDNALTILSEYCLEIPISTGLIWTCHYWIFNTWTAMANQYCARPSFHNGHCTTPVLPDTGAVLTISAALVLSEYGDDNALPILAKYCIEIPVSTGFIQACHYWLTITWTVLAISTGTVLITITRDFINNKWKNTKMFNLFISILISTQVFMEFLL